MTWVDVVTVMVLVAIGVRLASGARIAVSGRGRAHIVAIVRGLRPRHFLLVPPVFTVTVAVIIGLLQIPGLDFGWWTAIGGIGNPVTGGTDRTTGTVFEWLVPLVFLVMLLPALPLFAEAEERIFRLGAEHRSNWGRVGKAVQFGLVHALIGIPIGVALGLSVAGGYFTLVYLWSYRRSRTEEVMLEEPLMESTRAHLAYNLEIILVVIVALFAL